MRKNARRTRLVILVLLSTLTQGCSKPDTAIQVAPSDSVIAIEFPDYTVDSSGIPVPFLGHAGILFIDGSTGASRYFEYGRYDQGTRLGLVQKKSVKDATVDAAGRPSDTSLKVILRSISHQSGQDTKILAAWATKDNAYGRVLKYVQDREKENSDPNRKPYAILTNNCMHFVKLAMEAGKITMPTMIDPRPNSYIDELRDDFVDVDYDYSSDKLTIGS